MTSNFEYDLTGLRRDTQTHTEPTALPAPQKSAKIQIQ